MSKKLAPMGENKVSELREVLVRLSETAQKVESFISRYREAGYADHQDLMEKNLWNFEPYFTELMEVFHCAMEDFRQIAVENLEAQRLLFNFPRIRMGSSIHVQLAMKSISWMACDWLTAHLEEKDNSLIRTVGYLLDRMSDRAVVRIGVIALLIHWHWVLTPEERNRLEKNDWE